MNNREIAEKIFMEGVKSVLPEKLITRVMKLDGSLLKVNGHEFHLESIRNIYVIGAGKASAAMGHYVETILGSHITGGHIVVKYGHSCKLKRIKVTEAGHPIPDSNSFRATAEIIRIAEQADHNDLVFCLISGGGSALMTDLPAGLLPEELYIVNNLLIKCGATIHEINCVRKHLSVLKGGQLARIIFPARLVTLIISDVTGNLLDVIASGPTVPDTSTFAEALAIIEKYRLTNDFTTGVMNYIKDGILGVRPETLKSGDPLFSGTVNILAGTNLIALEAAMDFAQKMGFKTYILDKEMQGDVDSVAEFLFNAAVRYKNNPEIPKPVCLILGGETTVKVSEGGTGGRNQHFALSAALHLKNCPGITILSAGTDGTDGPTDAAGAVVDSYTVKQAESVSIDPEKYLKGFDSYNFFRKTGGHIMTGPTFTNVMDIVVVLVE